MRKKRLFEEIKNDLQKKVFGDAIRKKWSPKTGLRQLLQHKDTMIDGRKFPDLRTQVEQAKSIDRLGKGEILLERVFTASVENIFNQFNLMSGLTPKELNSQTKHMNIDLVLTDGNRKIKEMIELKHGNSQDSPLSAMFELIMYYFILRNAKGIDSNNYPDVVKKPKLTILAPAEYYGDGNEELLNKIARWASDKVKTAKISFQKIDIKECYLKEAEKILGKFNKIFEERESIQ